MAKFKLKQIFPCGYELDLEVSGFGLRDFSDATLLKECPLHGKKCVSARKQE